MLHGLLNTIVCGLLIGIFISAPMGPIGMLVIRRTLNRGRIPALFTGLGASLSDMIYCLLTGLGLSFVTEFIESNQSILQIAGSIVLIVYGLFLLRSNPSRNLSKGDVPSDDSRWRDFVTGFILTFSNPLILFFIVGLFARFNFMESDSTIWDYALGYLSIAAGAAGWWLLITYGVDRIRSHFNIRSMWLINRAIALLLIIMALGGCFFAFKDLLKY